jgi:hypothetical protein
MFANATDYPAVETTAELLRRSMAVTAKPIARETQK